MIAFIDFEASSLGRRGFPVEVGWVFETGAAEGHLIRPAPGWEEWAAEAEAIHGLTRECLEREGTAHDVVARRLLASLSGHAVHASAPSWDGQWLSRLLRAAGLPRHALRLRDTDQAQAEAVAAALGPLGLLPEERRAREAEIIAAAQSRAEADGPPAHRALADARREWRIWQEVGRIARAEADRRGG